MILFVAFVISLFFALARGGHVLHDEFTVLGDVPSSAFCTLHFHLVGQRERELTNFLFRVSDPRSPQYGAYWNDAKLRKKFGATTFTVETVSNSIRNACDVQSISLSPFGDILTAVINVHCAANYLRWNPRIWKHRTSNLMLVRGTHYSVPEELRRLVHWIDGTTLIPRQKGSKRGTAAFEPPMSARGAVNPWSIRQLWNIDEVGVNSYAGNSIAIHEMGDNFSPSDLALFFLKTGNVSNYVISKAVDNNPSQPGDEGQLDVVYAMGVTVPKNSFVPSIDALYFNFPDISWLDWSIALQSSNNSVHTISWYNQEETDLDLATTTAISLQFQKLGLNGKTLLFCSGDVSVHCTSDCAKFQATFPSNIAYITSVGGAVHGKNGTEWGWWGSSGGFSTYFPRPSFQNAAVSNYLSKTSQPPLSYFNATGRAFPDISGYSANCTFVKNGGYTFEGGTSCAAPTVAGVIALLNQIQLKRGRPVLGWINPWIYGLPASAFTDIVTGENDHGSTSSCCPKAFSAAVGWDAVTGLGLPKFDIMKKFLP